MTGDATTELWRFEASGLEANGVAVANGVVYFKPSSDPNLYAFDTTGTKLAAIPVGGSNSGVAISRGRVFLGLGDVFSNGFNFNAPGGIVALGVDDGDDHDRDHDHGGHGRGNGNPGGNDRGGGHDRSSRETARSRSRTHRAVPLNREPPRRLAIHNPGWARRRALPSHVPSKPAESRGGHGPTRAVRLS